MRCTISRPWQRCDVQFPIVRYENIDVSISGPSGARWPASLRVSNLAAALTFMRFGAPWLDGVPSRATAEDAVRLGENNIPAHALWWWQATSTTGADERTLCLSKALVCMRCLVQAGRLCGAHFPRLPFFRCG
jgi:hypothetical protein